MLDVHRESRPFGGVNGSFLSYLHGRAYRWERLIDWNTRSKQEFEVPCPDSNGQAHQQMLKDRDKGKFHTCPSCSYFTISLHHNRLGCVLRDSFWLDAGTLRTWPTPLTMDRISKIIWHLPFRIYTIRGEPVIRELLTRTVWRLHDTGVWLRPADQYTSLTDHTLIDAPFVPPNTPEYWQRNGFNEPDTHQVSIYSAAQTERLTRSHQ